MHMPKPTDAHNKLSLLAGRWSGQETMPPSPWDPKGGTAIGKFRKELGIDGFFLIVDYTQERDGATTYRGHGVYGYDAKRERYTMYWFDSMGNDPGGPALGTWEGDTLCFEHETPMGRSRYVYRFHGPDRHELRIETGRDGEWTTFLQADYRRES